MCGRFTLTQNEETLQEHYGLDAGGHAARKRYNVAPTQGAPVLLIKDGSRAFENMRWGLVPGWAKDESIGNRMINARAETVAEKPGFRSAFASRRCLVPADGFYEWKKAAGRGGAKTPVRFTLKGGGIFSFAGLWERWRGPGEAEDLHTFTIITTGANELVARVHARMPVMLRGDDEEQWLNEGGAGLLKPFPEEMMDAYAVSPAVNSPSNDSEECIARTGPVSGSRELF